MMQMIIKAFINNQVILNAASINDASINQYFEMLE